MTEYDKDQIESALRIDFDAWNERMLKELLGVAYRECQLLQSRLESLEKDANACRVSLLTQIHELADHIERAAPCCGDSDMRKQMLGQREFALMVSGKWNQNGNPFAAMQSAKD